MSKTAPSKSNFVPCPEGTWNALLVDISEPFDQVRVYNNVPKHVWVRRFVWQVSETMPPPKDVTRFTVTANFTDTLSPKGLMRGIVEKLVGAKLKPDEGIEMENLVGTPCMVQVVHNKVAKNGEEVTYANVAGILALPKGMAPLAHDGGWTRWVNRRPDEQPDWYRGATWKPAQMEEPNDLPAPTDSFDGPDGDIPF